MNQKTSRIQGKVEHGDAGTSVLVSEKKWCWENLKVPMPAFSMFRCLWGKMMAQDLFVLLVDMPSLAQASALTQNILSFLR